MNNPFFNDQIPKKTSKFIIVLQLLSIFTVILIVTWIVLLEQNQVRGPSMQPNFVTGQFLLVNRIPNYLSGSGIAKAVNVDYQRGDVVVFKKPGLEDFVKRVIGLPGETIKITDGKFYINNRKLDEEYISDSLETNGGDLIRANGNAILIPAGTYALVGDNRPQSNDSRYAAIGFIKQEWIKGKVLLRIWPFDVFGVVKQGDYSLK